MRQNMCIRALANVEQINDCREEVAGLDENIKNLSGMLNLAGNEVRFKILFLLNRERELCVCDMSDILGMNVSAISQHLRKLKDGGILQNRREAQTIFYSVKPDIKVLLQPFFTLISANETVNTEDFPESDRAWKSLTAKTLQRFQVFSDAGRLKQKKLS